MYDTEYKYARGTGTLLILSLWVARIIILASIVHIIAYSFFFSDTENIVDGAFIVIVSTSLGAIPVIHYLTVQT
jgi:hypothetical protein